MRVYVCTAFVTLQNGEQLRPFIMRIEAESENGFKAKANARNQYHYPGSTTEFGPIGLSKRGEYLLGTRGVQA